MKLVTAVDVFEIEIEFDLKHKNELVMQVTELPLLLILFVVLKLWECLFRKKSVHYDPSNPNLMFNKVSLTHSCSLGTTFIHSFLLLRISSPFNGIDIFHFLRCLFIFIQLFKCNQSPQTIIQIQKVYQPLRFCFS